MISFLNPCWSVFIRGSIKIKDFLTLTRTLKTDGATSFAMIWPSRSMVTRLLEQRQANARAAGTAPGAKLDESRGCRRRVEQLLQDTSRKVEERDKLLAEYADKIDKLQRELVAEIPAQKRWQELDQLGPADLVKALPPGAVFINFIRYTRFDYVEKKQKRTPCYVAFVVGGKAPSPPVPLPKSTRRLLQNPLASEFAPNGAEVNSQGQKPLEYVREDHSSPEGAEVENERRTFAPSGLDRIGHDPTRGMRPWLLTSTPSGLFSSWLTNSESPEFFRSLDGEETKPPLVSGVVRVELDDTAGEGVQGLQRAFHLAGCPNVVASLWKVNDSATAALMTKFYHEMWVNKKPPIEALREAQLTIYRHPELIPALAGERGRPDLDKAVRLPAATGQSGGHVENVPHSRADTRLWAAFVLSGVGR